MKSNLNRFGLLIFIISIFVPCSIFANNDALELFPDSFSDALFINSSISNDSESLSQSYLNSAGSRSSPELQDWKTFDSSKRVCLAKHAYAIIKRNKTVRVALSWGTLGFTGGMATLVIPFTSIAVFITSVYAPWFGIPALALGGYYGHKMRVQNSRQIHLLQLMLVPEMEIEKLFEAHAYLTNLNSTKSISQNYDYIFRESMKTNSKLCNKNGSLKSLKKALISLPRDREIFSSHDMSELELNIANYTAEYLKYKNAIDLLQAKMNLLKKTKGLHILASRSKNNEARIAHTNKDINTFIRYLNEQKILSTANQITKPKDAIQDLSNKIANILKISHDLLTRWVKEEGNILALEHMNQYNDEISTYPKLSMKQKFQRWQVKKNKNN